MDWFADERDPHGLDHLAPLQHGRADGAADGAHRGEDRRQGRGRGEHPHDPAPPTRARQAPHQGGADRARILARQLHERARQDRGVGHAHPLGVRPQTPLRADELHGARLRRLARGTTRSLAPPRGDGWGGCSFPTLVWRWRRVRSESRSPCLILLSRHAARRLRGVRGSLVFVRQRHHTQRHATTTRLFCFFGRSRPCSTSSTSSSARSSRR